ncbi:MAG: anti-sigma factor [Acidimicrobiales bacterium]
MNEDELAAFLEGDALTDGFGGAGDEPGRDAAEHLRSLLDDEALWAEPSPGGVEALLGAIKAETGIDPSPRHLPRPSPSPSRRRAPTGWLVAVAAAAVVALVVGVVGGLAIGGDDGGAGQEFDVAGTDLAPDASAVASVEMLGSGAAIELDVQNLAPAPLGTYYQAWVKNAEGDLVTVGTFHVREGDDHVELWAGVDLERYTTLTVTIQQEGAGQESSGQVVLTGVISE